MASLIGEQLMIFLNDYPFLRITFLGNKIGDYVVFFLFFFLFFLILIIFRNIVLIKIKRIIKLKIGNQIITAIDSVKKPFYWLIAFYFSVNLLNLNPLLLRIINGVLLVSITYQVIKIIQIFIDCGLHIFYKKEKDREAQSAISTLGKIAKWSLWLIASLLILSNLGVNVTSIMAGLGIGGIAIAFSLQNILADLFSSFAIYFDKPFIVGDFIIVGEHMGTVEKIGIKTTRLRALQGEEIVISNKELTSNRIQNFKKMKKRRIVFNFGVIYDTSLEKLKKINSIVSRVIKKEKLSEFDRVHFCKFNDFSLDFEVVYYILSGDYTDYMDTHQNILFEMKKNFEKEEISMAFPTQTIHIEKNK